MFLALATNLRRLLVSLDVSAAFLKGLAFEDLSEADGAGTKTGVRRAAYFDLPEKEDYEILYSLDATAFALLAIHFLNDLCIEAFRDFYA